MGTSFQACAMFCYVFLALIGAAAGANVMCMAYSKDDGGGEGFDGYYTRELPGNCRGQHGPVANWKPTYKIKNPIAECPGGWKQFRDSCYYDMRQRGHHHFKAGEEECNK